jgi:hypothetical protein
MQRFSGRICRKIGTMATSSTSSTLPRFFVHAPDKTDPDAFSRRLSVRSKHLEGAKKAIAEGSIRTQSTGFTPHKLTHIMQASVVRC